MTRLYKIHLCSLTILSWDCSSISRLWSVRLTSVISDRDVWRVSVLTATSLLRASLCERKSIGKQSGKSFVGFYYNLCTFYRLILILPLPGTRLQDLCDSWQQLPRSAHGFQPWSLSGLPVVPRLSLHWLVRSSGRVMPRVPKDAITNHWAYASNTFQEDLLSVNQPPTYLLVVFLEEDQLFF